MRILEDASALPVVPVGSEVCPIMPSSSGVKDVPGTSGSVVPIVGMVVTTVGMELVPLVVSGISLLRQAVSASISIRAIAITLYFFMVRLLEMDFVYSITELPKSRLVIKTIYEEKNSILTCYFFMVLV